MAFDGDAAAEIFMSRFDAVMTAYLGVKHLPDQHSKRYMVARERAVSASMTRKLKLRINSMSAFTTGVLLLLDVARAADRAAKAARRLAQQERRRRQKAALLAAAEAADVAAAAEQRVKDYKAKVKVIEELGRRDCSEKPLPPVDDEALDMIMTDVSLEQLDDKTVQQLLHLALVKRKMVAETLEQYNRPVVKTRGNTRGKCATVAYLDPASPRITDEERSKIERQAYPAKTYHDKVLPVEAAMARACGVADVCERLSRSCDPFFLYKHVVMRKPHADGKVRIYTRRHLFNHSVYLVFKMATVSNRQDLVSLAEDIRRRFLAK